MRDIILSLDQGTSSSRAIAFSAAGEIVAVAQQEFAQHFPQDGWVEHDPQEIWATTQATAREVLAQLDTPPIGVAITNQRETFVVWERGSGKPIAPAIVWQDRRTADICDQLRPAHEKMFRDKTGLLLDPYFSMTKLAWLLDNTDGARAKAEAGELAFGTIDCWLLWQLTNGAQHKTDITNAARTGLFNIHMQKWDEELLKLFNIPAALLPAVCDNVAEFGITSDEAIGAQLPICAMAGDQQAAAFGQACFAHGAIKSTYGTGCFLLAHTGNKPVASQNRLLTTIAYRIGGETSYALEGSIFMAGAIVHWLRDGLQLIDKSAETEALARAANPQDKTICIPAFTGLGAPHWQPHARAALFNMTRTTGRADIIRAALEAISHQTDDLLTALAADMNLTSRETLRIDGGAIKNDWLCQNLSDICDCQIDRPQITETTALGVAYMAFFQRGVFADFDAIAANHRLDKQFSPVKSKDWGEAKRTDWQAALNRVLVRN